jgi:uncharacterized membrane protein YesL
VTLPSIILVFSVGFVGFWVKKSQLNAQKNKNKEQNFN